MAYSVREAEAFSGELRGAESASLVNLPAAEVSRVALKAFFSLATEWDLTKPQCITLLGTPSERTYYRWRQGQISALPPDTLERISLLLGIYKAIHILLPDKSRANAWVHKPNSAFGGRSALEVMLQGRMDHLYHVRRHLDRWRG